MIWSRHTRCEQIDLFASSLLVLVVAIDGRETLLIGDARCTACSSSDSTNHLSSTDATRCHFKPLRVLNQGILTLIYIEALVIVMTCVDGYIAPKL